MSRKSGSLVTENGICQNKVVSILPHFNTKGNPYNLINFNTCLVLQNLDTDSPIEFEAIQITECRSSLVNAND